MLTYLIINKMDTYNTLIQTFFNVQSKFSRFERSPRDFGTSELLYPLEIHIIDAIGQNNEIKMTDLAEKMEITKGAVSQVIKKLVKKGYVIKFKDEGNSKNFHLKLRNKGEIVFREHRLIADKIIEKIGAVLKQIPEKEIAILDEGFKMVESELNKLLKP